jgi:penicillin amidase
LALHQIVKYLSNPSPDYFGADAIDQRNRRLRDSLEIAAARLSGLQGPDPTKWSWGALHIMKVRHPLDQAPGAEALMDPGPVPRPGDAVTVDATGYDTGSFHQSSGASYRQIIDTSDWDKSMAVNVPGQSGQPGSKHYSDLLPLWTEGKYFPLEYSKDAVEKAATDILTLEP